MSRILIISFLCFCLLGCQRQPKIEITRDYIYNSSWGKNNPTGVSFTEIEVAPSIKSKNPDSIRGFEIYNNRVLDMDPRQLPWKYVWFNKEANLKKIYFSKKNEDGSWRIRGESNPVAVFGKLELDTWYQFYGLHPTEGSSWEHYVYVDKDGVVHLWAVMVGNW